MTDDASAQLDTNPLSRFAPQITCLLILLALIDSQVVSAIAPQIAAGLAADQALVATAATVYSIAAAMVALGLARMSRIREPQRWLPLSGAIFAVATLVAAASPNIVVFYAARAMCGCAGGLISALAIAALANASSYDRRGGQMTWVAVSYFLAPVLGVPIATLLTGQFGWRVAFLVSATAVGLCAVLVKMVPLSSLHNLATTTSDGPREGTLAKLWRLSTQSRSARHGLISAFFVSGGLVGFTAFLGVWLNQGFGAGTGKVGAVYAVAGLGAVIGGALGGKLSDRFGKRVFAARGSLVLALLLVMVPAFTWGLPLWLLIAITAFVASLRVAPLQALVTEIVTPEERPTYIALRNGASQLGIASAVAAAGWLFGPMGFMGIGFLCAVLSLLAWASLSRIEDPHDEPQTIAPRRRSWLRRIAVAMVGTIVFLAIALPWSLSFLVTKAWTRPNERNLPDTPAIYGVGYEDVSFKSVDGNQLSGWFLPGTDRGVTIVMSHGLFRSRFELLHRGADLAKDGYGVLIYDFRRHGKSPGEFCTLGYEERRDVEAAIAYARDRTPENRIVLFGVSMGAAATLLAASETSGIAAVIADSSFLSLQHTIYHHLALAHIPVYPFAPMLVWFTSLRMSYLPGQFDVADAVRHTSCPILFIGGSSDVRMPIETVLDPLYDASTSPLKEKFIVTDATHGHAYDQDPAGYVNAVNTFLQKALADTPAR